MNLFFIWMLYTTGSLIVLLLEGKCKLHPVIAYYVGVFMSLGIIYLSAIEK